MTSIKKPSSTGVSGIETPDSSSAPLSGSPSGPSFRDRVDGASPAQQVGGTSASKNASTVSDPTQATMADLQAGRISGDQAVANLTEAAMRKNNVPPVFRGAVEAQVRALLTRDPAVGELLKNIGATLQEQSSDK